MIFCKPYHQL